MTQFKNFFEEAEKLDIKQQFKHTDEEDKKTAEILKKLEDNFTKIITDACEQAKQAMGGEQGYYFRGPAFRDNVKNLITKKLGPVLRNNK